MQQVKIKMPMPKRRLNTQQEPGSFVEIRSHAETVFRLPTDDNTPESLRALQAANAHFRTVRWPSPYDTTTHHLRLGDARKLSHLPDGSVHLVVTSPPYWTLKQYKEDNGGQMGDIADYEAFLAELDKVWRECRRVLVGGGRICCVVGDVCISRKRGGRHYIMPLHADIQVRARALGLDCLTPVLWHKIANGVTEAEGNGAGFYGKPYQPGSIIKNDAEHILFLRKGGEYRSVDPLKRALSMLTKEEMQDLKKQVSEFKHRSGDCEPICVGIVGINTAEVTTGYEGDRSYRTDGSKNKHPYQEAPEAHRRLLTHAAPVYDEFLVLRYKATNEPPYPFEWVDYTDTVQEYGSILTRISRNYEKRF